MNRALTVMGTTLLCLGSARAEPFWVGWTGDDWPENHGWTHVVDDPPAVRWLEGGKLFIDSRADWYISDIYNQIRPDQFVPRPGEIFVAQWSIRVDELTGYVDPALHVQANAYYEVHLSLGLDGIHSSFEPGTWAPFAPGEFHEFRFESTDMRNYSLYIDGSLGFSGTFFCVPAPLGDDGIGWGDMASDRSLAEWRYFQYGILADAVPGDVNCDGAIDVFDIDPFVAALTDLSEYYAITSDCDPMLADVNEDGSVNVFDIDPFVDLLLGS